MLAYYVLAMDFDFRIGKVDWSNGNYKDFKILTNDVDATLSMFKGYISVTPDLTIQAFFAVNLLTQLHIGAFMEFSGGTAFYIDSYFSKTNVSCFP